MLSDSGEYLVCAAFELHRVKTCMQILIKTKRVKVSEQRGPRAAALAAAGCRDQFS